MMVDLVKPLHTVPSQEIQRYRASALAAFPGETEADWHDNGRTEKQTKKAFRRG